MQDEVTRQSNKIADLEKMMKQISELSGNQVSNDQLKKVQEEHLNQLTSIRAQTAKAYDNAMKASIGGSAGNTSGENVSKQKYDELEAENKNLQYRITQLTKALEEGDAGQGIKKVSSGGAQSGEITKMYFTEQGMNSNDVNQI